MQRMKKTRRTCNLILGVGDGNTGYFRGFQYGHSVCNLILGVGDGNKGYFRGFQYGHSVCNVVNDTHPLPSESWHPSVKDTVYWGMDWLCPPYHERLSELLTSYHGNITA